MIEPKHDHHPSTASSALLLWSIGAVLLVAPALGLAVIGLRGITLLAAATVGGGIAFGVAYLKYSEVFLRWLESRTQIRSALAELESRAGDLKTLARHGAATPDEVTKERNP